jgi:hypothetical protein
MLLKRRLSVLWAAAIMLLTVLLASGAAMGITNGTADGGRHPNVGALMEIPKRGEPYPYCTGTLISETVFLTAAHCYPENGDTSFVTFEEVPSSTSKVYQGTFYDDPKIDIAVVVLDQSPGITPAQLPYEGQVASEAKSTKWFTAVGYGGELAPKQPGGPVIVYDDQREWAVSTFKSFNGTYLRLSQNQDSGGTCYGDSGGPNFFGGNSTPETNVIASTTITGDAWCKATNVTLRLDTAPVRAFLDDYVTLP